LRAHECVLFHLRPLHPKVARPMKFAFFATFADSPTKSETTGRHSRGRSSKAAGTTDSVPNLWETSEKGVLFGNKDYLPVYVSALKDLVATNDIA